MWPINNIKQYLWLYPFIAFFGTYISLHIIFASHAFPAPHIVGKDLIQATKILSQYKLHPRILQTKEDPDLPEATVLNQIPSPGRAVKENQTVYIVISEQQEKKMAPHCLRTYRTDISRKLKKQGLKPKYYQLPYPYPRDMCFAQWPEPGEPLESTSIVIYLAKETPHLMIWPDLKGKQANDAQALLQEHDIAVELKNAHARTSPDHAIIVDQRPIAGSVVDLATDQTIIAQLKIASNTGKKHV